MRVLIQNWSSTNRPIVLYLFLFLSALLLMLLSDSAASSTRDANVVWAVSPEDDVAGHNIYYGSTSRYDADHNGYDYVDNVEPGDYVVSGSEVPRAEYLLSGLERNRPYWIAVSAYDEAGNESSYSNEKHLPGMVNTTFLTMSSASGGGGCQAVPGAPSEGPLKTFPGWLLLLSGVPLWTLALRKRCAARVRTPSN